MTYSITAFDRDTGRWGVAVQSCVFAVGIRVPAVREGIGAVAVQAGSPSWYRRPAVELLARGASAPDVVAALAALPQADVGQFVVVDGSGTAAAHTGPACTFAAGHAIGDGVAAAANLCESDGIWEAMLRAYEKATGSLETRLLAALQAGEETGGDVRGRQSAAIAVTEGSLDGRAVFETDVRVDDSADPVGELGRVLTVKAAHDELRHAFPDGRSGDWESAASRLSAVAGEVPEDFLVTLWTGAALALAGRPDEALPHLSRAARQNPRWLGYFDREPMLPTREQREVVIDLLRTAQESSAPVDIGSSR